MLMHLVLVVVLICPRINYCISSENWTKTCETISVFCFQVFFGLLCVTFFMVHQDIQETGKTGVIFFSSLFQVCPCGCGIRSILQKADGFIA